MEIEVLAKKGLNKGINQNFNAGIETKSTENHFVCGGNPNRVVTNKEQADDNSGGKSEMIAAVEFEQPLPSSMASACQCHYNHDEH
jgi:hypothetical protein